MIKRKFGLAVVLLLVFLAGYIVRGMVGLPHNFIYSAEPPSPHITINGEDIHVYQSTFTWCTTIIAAIGAGSCKSADYPSPEDAIKINGYQPESVLPGAVIKTKAPRGVKEFTITRKGATDSGGDPYIVPNAKGVYLYNLHLVWFADQGDAEFFFQVEVK